MAGANHLGQFIKECRTGLKYTSRRVEEITRSRPGLAAISHSNLLAIEKGAHVPTFDKILTLSLVFNVPTRHFEDRLKQDMLGERQPASDASYDKVMLAAAAALSEGHHPRALELYSEAHAIALAEDPRPHEAEWWRRVGEARLQAANCRKRLGLLRLAKEDLEELLAGERVPAGIAVRSSFLLAEVYRDLKNHRLALLHARASLELATEAGDPILRARILNTVANILDDRGDTQSAIAYYREALAVFEQIGDRRAVGMLSRNLGDAHLSLGDLESASRHLSQGIQIARAVADCRGLAYGLANRARVFYLQGDTARSRECAREAKQIAQTESYPDVLFTSLFYLWKAAQRGGETSLARVYADRLGALYRKLETRCVESEEWSNHTASARRIRA